MSRQTEALHRADVIDLSHDGRGVADLDGKRVFLAGALPGEHVELKTRKKRRKSLEAELVEVLAPSTARVEPACPWFGTCGGCALQHLDYDAQLEFKSKTVADNLARIGGVEPAEWLPALTGEQWNYRRRARLGIKYVIGKERVLVGFRERSAPYITDMSDCRVLVEPFDRLPALLAELVAASPLRQRIPQAELAAGDDARAMILRVLDPPSAEDIDAWIAFGEQQDIDIYLQTGGPSTVAPISPSPRQLSYSVDSGAVTLEFEPGDFIQVNAAMNRVMVDTALEAAAIEPGDRVLDLYCGIGNFSLPIARRAGEVLGVEGSAALVARASGNARLNGIGNARFVAADLSESDWPFFREDWDLVFLDPARAGAEEAVKAASAMRPRRIVYVSCHPGTLARDAGDLVRNHGYRLTSARVLDMFPHTHHVEVITVFDRDA